MWMVSLAAAAAAGVTFGELVDALLTFLRSAQFGLLLVCLGIGTLIALRLDRLDRRASVEEGAR